MSDKPSLLVGRRVRLLAVYRTVATVLLSYGWQKAGGWFRGREATERALNRCHLRNARRVRDVILEVQGLFIKVGQMISILTNFLPANFRQQLEGLQDRIPSRPLEEIEGRLRRELGAGPRELFASFDAEPIASASLAQVHGATLDDGERVAVKVQHFEIEELARLDLQTIRNILRIVGLVLRIRGLGAAFEEIREMILDELDFTAEADHIEAIGAHFDADSGVFVPRVVRERSSQRVLTTSFVEGCKVTDIGALEAAGLDPHEVAERVVRAYCQMIFVDGLYHADPHPGNILVRPDGGIVFLDFGAVSQLSPALKSGLPDLVKGILERDPEKTLSSLRAMGFVGEGGDQQIAERVIDYFYARFLEHIELESWSLQDLQVDAKLKMEILADLARLDIGMSDLASTFQVPKEWVLLHRTLVLLLGVSSHLHPQMQPLTIIRPYLEEFVSGEDGDWVALVSKTLRDLALSALTVPADLKGLLAQARRGEASLEIGGVREGFELVYSIGQQLLFGLLAIASAGLAWWADLHGDETWRLGFAISAGLNGALLVLSMIRSRRGRRQLRRSKRIRRR